MSLLELFNFSFKANTWRKNRSTIADEVRAIKSAKKDYYDEKIKLEEKKLKVYEECMKQKNELLAQLIHQFTASKDNDK